MDKEKILNLIKELTEYCQEGSKKITSFQVAYEYMDIKENEEDNVLSNDYVSKKHNLLTLLIQDERMSKFINLLDDIDRKHFSNKVKYDETIKLLKEIEKYYI